jgi:type I restriction enzyme R subunit
LDEVHRSYNPEGTFYAKLANSDRNAIHIGLSGTPLITGDFKSKEIFGDYFINTITTNPLLTVTL